VYYRRNIPLDMLWYFVSIMFKLLCITCTRTTGRGCAMAPDELI
jgi:hypothetical protein